MLRGILLAAARLSGLRGSVVDYVNSIPITSNCILLKPILVGIYKKRFYK